MDNAIDKKGLSEDKTLNRDKKRLIFYVLLIAIPSIQFAIFYIYVNINSVILAFQKYSEAENGIGYDIEFALFENLSFAWGQIIGQGRAILNSLLLYISNLIIVTCLALLFSYYIAKKCILSGFFRVILFLPQIIAALSLAYIFKIIVDFGLPELVRVLGIENSWLSGGIISNGNAPETARFITILFYNIWVGFGANVMLYTGSMSSIDPSITESAQLDGIGFFGEFWYIYFPLSWSTFTTFVVTGLTAVFTSTMNLTAFFGDGGVEPQSLNVFGYYLYCAISKASLVPNPGSGYLSYSQVSSIGLIITLVLVPITLTLRKVMETFGPRTDK